MSEKGATQPYSRLVSVADKLLEDADDDVARLARSIDALEQPVRDELLVSDLLNAYQVFYYFFRIEPDAVLVREEQDAGEMLCGLDVHVFIIAQVGQLGPEGDVQGEGKFQGRLSLLVGQDGHGGGV